MSFTEQEIRSAATQLTEAFGELLTWHWEEDKHVLLAEFASGKTDKVVAILNKYYADEWNRKSIKHAPNTMTQELGGYAKLVKEQRVFTNSPTENEKTVVSLLWPWGHGSTLSLRLTLLETPYEYVEAPQTENFITRLFNKIKRILA